MARTVTGDRLAVPDPPPVDDTLGLMYLTTWQKELDAGMQDTGDPGPIEHVAPDESVLVVWTETRVYFRVVYDGSEWIGSAPRNSTDKGQRHVGSQ